MRAPLREMDPAMVDPRATRRSDGLLALRPAHCPEPGKRRPTARAQLLRCAHRSNSRTEGWCIHSGALPDAEAAPSPAARARDRPSVRATLRSDQWPPSYALVPPKTAPAVTRARLVWRRKARRHAGV